MPREETTLLLLNRSPCNPLDYFFKACERILNRTHQNSSDSLKALMVAPFADMPREKITLAWSHYRSRFQHFKEAESGFIKKNPYPLIYIFFLYYKKNQAYNFIFECVRSLV